MECHKYIAEHGVYKVHNISIGARYAGVTATETKDVRMVKAIEYR